MSEPMPTRKALLFVVDTKTGKSYPVKVIIQTDNTALLPFSLEKDSVGLATENTLSGIKSQTDRLMFDDNNRLYITDPPNLDIPMSYILAFGTQTRRSLSDIYTIISNTNDSISDLKLKLFTEGRFRCYDVEVPENNTFAVPYGTVWYVTDILCTGDLYLDGEVKVV